MSIDGTVAESVTRTCEGSRPAACSFAAANPPRPATPPTLAPGGLAGAGADKSLSSIICTFGRDASSVREPGRPAPPSLCEVSVSPHAMSSAATMNPNVLIEGVSMTFEVSPT
jgi:hypothetical protein